MTTTSGMTTTGPTMTTPTTSGTTDGARRRFARVSVRTRITVVIALLTAVAMTGAGLLVYALESARIERQVNAQISQEIAEFRALRIDPNTGEEFDDVGRVLNVFLTRNVPDDDEMLVGYVRGETPERTVNRYGQEVLDEPAYQDALAELDGVGGTRVIESPTFGETWVTLVPVTNTQGEGSLVIVNFLRDEHEELDRTLRTYTLIALLSLGLITTIAGFQSGRLLAPLRTLESTAREITTTDLSRRIPERGNDDITALTRTINSMLERLDSGFAAQRQFLDDAGHELKTPLTVLRGHLELLDGEDPAELAADARAPPRRGRPDVPPRAGPHPAREEPPSRLPRPGRRCDLADLTQSVLAKATRARRPRAGSSTASPAAARCSTSSGSPRRCSSSPTTRSSTPTPVPPSRSARPARTAGCGCGSATRVTGSRPRTARPCFERFGRSHVRAGDDGFGLGLSIVRAIADAHGGDVRITDAEPDGAHVASIVLPDRETRPMTRPDRRPDEDGHPWPRS